MRKVLSEITRHRVTYASRELAVDAAAARDRREQAEERLAGRAAGR